MSKPSFVRAAFRPATTSSPTPPLTASLAFLLRQARLWLPASSAALVLATSGLPAHADPPIFNVGSGNWETAGNWTTGTVPDSTTQETIYIGGVPGHPDKPTVNVTVAGDTGGIVSDWGFLNINAGASLTLGTLIQADAENVTGVATVFGTLTVTQQTRVGGYGTGTITVKSGGVFNTNEIYLGGGSLNIEAGGLVSVKFMYTGGAGSALNFKGGTLQGAADNFISGTTGFLNVSADSTIDTNGFSTGIGWAISGTGGLIKAGTGSLTFNASATYTGGTTINGGSLIAGKVNALVNNTAYTVNSGGTLDLNGFALTASSLAGTGTVKLGTGTLTINQATDATFAGALTGSGGLTKSGAGALTLSGTNNYGGTTTINGGALVVGSSNNLGAGPLALNGGTLRMSTGFTIASAASLGAGGGKFDITSGVGLLSGIVSGTGGPTKSGTGTLTLGGVNTYTGNTAVTGGTLAVGADTALGAATASLNLDGGALQTTTTFTTNRAIAIGTSGGSLNVGTGTTLTASGVLSGSGLFNKNGAGTLALTGTSTHSGGTAVNAGLLRVDGTLASSSVDVQSGATLAGAGTVSGNVFLRSGAALGDTSKIESLHIGGQTTFFAGSTWNVEGNNATFDQLTIDGVTTIQTGAKLNLTGTWNGASYTLLSTTGGISGGQFTLQNTVPTGYKLVYGQNSILLVQPPTIGTITATPTNSTIITGGQTNVAVTVQNAGQSGTAALNLTVTGSGNLSGTSGTTASITAGGTGSISTPLVFTGTTVGAGQTGTVTVTDPAAINSPQTGTVTVNVLDHAAPNLSITNGNNQTVIVGASGITAGLKLANGTAGNTNRSAMDVGSLSSGLTGATGSGVIASGSSSAYTATLNTGTVGTGQTQAFSLQAGDQQTMVGASALTTQSQNITLNVLDHAAPNFTLASGNNQTVIVGATGITATLNLANGTAGETGRSAMDVNTLSSGLSGATGSGVVASGSSGTYTAALNTGTVGAGQTQTFSLQAGDQQTLAGASALTAQSRDVTLDVYGHAAPSLSGTALDLGNIHAGYTSSVVSNSQTVTNGAVGDYIVDLKAGALTSGNVSVNGLSGLAAGDSTSISATLATGQSAGSLNQALTYTFADDSSLAGASSNIATATLNITGQVYTGQGVWNSAGGGSWGTLASGFGTNWQAGGGSPGLDTGFTDTDTATFGTAGHGTVTLDGANPSLKGITFDNFGASYLISSGTGGGITFNGGASAATLTDTNGSHEISAPITLATDLVATVAQAADRLTISGTITGSHDLTVQGDGNLLLSGNNTGFSGQTTINSGTVVTMHANALGTGLVTLHSGATLAPVVPLSLTSLTWNGGTISLDPTAAWITIGNTLDMTAPGQFFLTGQDPNTKYDLLTYTTLGSTTDAFSANPFYGIAPTFTVVDHGDGTSSVQVEYVGAIIGPVLSNAAPYFTPTTANFIVAEPSITTGGPNTVNSLFFTPGGTLNIFDVLTLTGGNVTAGAGTYAISGGTLFGPNGLHFDVAGNLFIGSTLIGDVTKTGPGALFLDSTLTGNLAVLQGLLGGNGTIIGNLINSATVSPGHSPGQIHVTGNYTQTSSGLLRIEVGGRDIHQHDLLSVDGSAHLDGPVQVVRLDGFKLKRNKPVTFLTAGGGVTGRFSMVQDDFASDTILQPTVVYHPYSVALEAVQGSFAALPNLTPNQKAVGRALDSAARDKRADAIYEYLDYRKLNKLPGDLEKIAPEELTSIFTIGTSLAQVQSGNIQRRTDDIRSGSAGFSAAGLAVNGAGPSYSGSFGSAGPAGPSDDGKDVKNTKDVVAPAENRWGVFLSGTGEWVSVGNTENARGYDLTSGGFTLGLDYKVTPHLAIGLAAGYTGTTADLTDRGRVWVNGGKLGVYATAFSGGWYADTAVFGGYNSYSTRRSALQGEARGDTDGGELNVLFGTGYDFKRGRFTFGPTASFNYTYLGTNAFTEHGSLVPLNVHGGKGESLRTAFGLKASYDWKVGSVVIRPEIRAAWQHEFGDTAYALDSDFANGAGDAFRVNGPEMGRDSALLGAGFAIQFNERFSTYFYYDGELGRKDYQSTNVTGGGRLAF